MHGRSVIAVLAIVLALLPFPALARSSERCFPQTGHCISGVIRTYWERNGGLPVFGYPISPLRNEYVGNWEGPVQWFERDRLEDHTEEGLGVLAGRLGAQLLEMQGRPWETLAREDSAPRGCLYFEQTRHSLCGAFLSYWRRNGGLERFGYPLSPEMTEQVEDWRGTVQYFERRRMELHIELPGSPVLLGLLGRQTGDLPGRCFEAGPPMTATARAYREQFGCAYPYPRLGAIAYQPFERGAMLWMPGMGRRLGYGIVVITRDPATGSTSYAVYSDTWFEGQPVSGGETAPAGLFEPIRGFGKVWREVPGLRDALGWATAPEAADQGGVYNFERGTMLYRQSADRVYLLSYPVGRVTPIDEIQRIP